MENVEKSRVTVEQLEALQTSFEDFQAHVHHNVGRLQCNFQKMQECVKAQSKLMHTPPFIKSIFESLWLQCDLELSKILYQGSLQCKMCLFSEKSNKEDLNPSLVQSIQSLKCCPTVPEMKANSNALSAYSSNLIGVLNSIAKSDTCSPAMSLALKIAAETIGNLNEAFQDHRKEEEDVKRHPQKQRKVAEEVDRDSNVSFHQQVPKSKTYAVSKQLTLPQVKESHVQEAKSKGLPLERPVTALETPKDLQSPSADSLALSNIAQSVKKSKVCMESKKEMRKVTSFNKMAKDEPQNLAPLGIHHPSPPVKSFDLPQIPQSVEETKVDVVPVEDLQSPSPAHTHLSSILKRPQIQKPSLQTPDKPKTNKYVSAISGNSKEDDDHLLHNQTLVIDIKAQEYNLKHLDRSFENNKISSETYNQCKGNISQTLQSVDLRLGCLLRRYIRHVQLKQLG